MYEDIDFRGITVRDFVINDLPQMIELHRRYFASEFSFSEFSQHYMRMWAVERKGKIILAGGIRLIPEAVIVTDKEASVRDRGLALLRFLRASELGLRTANFDSLHVFVQDDMYKRQLEGRGFRPTKGDPLVYLINRDNNG